MEVLPIAYVKYSVPKKVSIVFHNGSNYYYHFVIKELVEELKKQFIVPIEKEGTTIKKRRRN